MDHTINTIQQVLNIHNTVQTLEKEIESLKNKMTELENKIDDLNSYKDKNTYKEELIEDLKEANEKYNEYEDTELYELIKYKSISYLEDILEKLNRNDHRCQECKEIGCGDYCNCIMCN